MNMNAYLRRCMMISLRRRAVWIIVGGVIGVILGIVLGLNVTGLATVGLLGAFITAISVAINSYQRHSRDIEAQP